MNADHEDLEITLPILESIEAQSDLTQRGLSERLNLALGLTNSYLKRCVRKGLVKIEQIPANRYLYYLTPKGFAEKSRLTACYLKASFQFYRQASDACLDIFQHCRAKNWEQVVICGVSDLAEIAIMQSLRSGIHVACVYDPSHRLDTFFGVSAYADLECIPKQSVCVITAVVGPMTIKEQLLAVTSNEKVLIPKILRCWS